MWFGTVATGRQINRKHPTIIERPEDAFILMSSRIDHHNPPNPQDPLVIFAYQSPLAHSMLLL